MTLSRWLLAVGLLSLLPAAGFCQMNTEPLGDALVPPQRKPVPPKLPLVPPASPLLQAENQRLMQQIQKNKAELKKLEERIKSARAEAARLERKAKPAVKVLDENCDEEFKDVLIKVQETRTGSLLFGLGVNSDAGVCGSVIINERNFSDMPSQCVLFDLITGKSFCRPAKPCWLEFLVKQCAEAVQLPIPCGAIVEGKCGSEETQEVTETPIPAAIEKRLHELEKKAEMVDAMQSELSALREQVRNLMPPMPPLGPDIDLLTPMPWAVPPYYETPIDKWNFDWQSFQFEGRDKWFFNTTPATGDSGIAIIF